MTTCIAANKRQAVLHEIQRLKVEGTLHAHGDHTETGSLTISNLTLPLKKDFLSRARRADGEAFATRNLSWKPTIHKPWSSFSTRKHPFESKPIVGMVTTVYLITLRNYLQFITYIILPELVNNVTVMLCTVTLTEGLFADDSEQFVVCLVRCQEHVLATTMLATSSVPPQQDALRFPGSLTLHELSTDFAIKLEVYTLQARRETISHEDKYHIKKVGFFLVISYNMVKDLIVNFSIIMLNAHSSTVKYFHIFCNAILARGEQAATDS